MGTSQRARQNRTSILLVPELSKVVGFPGVGLTLHTYLTGVFDFAHDFVAAFGHWIWAAYSGILFFFYPLVHRRISRFNVSTFFILLGRLLLLFFLSIGFAVVFGLWLRPQDRGEWQLGAFFLVMPAPLVASIAFILGFIARLLRNRII